MKDIVIIGSSGFAKEMLWLLEDNNEGEKDWNILGFVDNDKSKQLVCGYEILGNDEWLMNYPHPINAICGVGFVSLRRRIVEKYKYANSKIVFPTVVSRSARFSKRVTMGEGCIVCANSVLTTDITLGNFVTINLNCTIGHDVVIRDFVTINPGTSLSGNVLVDHDCEIGTGVSIIPGKHIGAYAVVGAGSVIIRDVPEHCTVVGNPGRILEK